MRRRNTQKFGDVLSEVLKVQHLDKRLNETRLLASWETVVGPSIVKYCGEKYIKNKVLYVKISSAVLRNELMLSRQQLVNSLNKLIGEEVICDIRFA